MRSVRGHCVAFARMRSTATIGFKELNLFLALICFQLNCISQDSHIRDTTVKTTWQYSQNSVNKSRVWVVTGMNVVGAAGSLLILSNTWYKNYAHTSFHTFNDDEEWLQVDKVGHGWTAYNIGRITSGMWQWAGLQPKKAAVIGGLSGTLYLTVIEFMDGHSAKWGWSWGDMAANIFGSGIFISQELLWKEQRIQYKFSFHHKDYGEPMLTERADNLFGQSWAERMLKDYNAQTYWLSANVRSFFRRSALPPWLNISFGYGADGMFGGFQNKWIDIDSGTEIDRTDIPRVRQFYLAPDVDFTKIKTNKKWLRTVFFCLNAFKCPAPALMIDSKGKAKVYPLYF
ncbi:MAG TPA: DUF2279 domain-containing protein [Chitinophagaceae bacterium]|nr:DUF2279 domain-containing protein [Chitinophagaceae bacterium]